MCFNELRAQMHVHTKVFQPVLLTGGKPTRTKQSRNFSQKHEGYLEKPLVTVASSHSHKLSNSPRSR